MLRGPWLHKGRSLFLMTSGAPQHSVAAGQVQRKFIRCVGVPWLTAPVWRVLRLKSKTTAEGFTCNRKSILLSSSQLVLIKENLGFSFCAKFYAKFARFFLHLCTFPPFLHVSVFERAAGEEGSDLGSGQPVATKPIPEKVKLEPFLLSHCILLDLQSPAYMRLSCMWNKEQKYSYFSYLYRDIFATASTLSAYSQGIIFWFHFSIWQPLFLFLSRISAYTARCCRV